MPPAWPHQTQTVTTFVRGRVRNSYFGLSPQDEMPYSERGEGRGLWSVCWLASLLALAPARLLA